MDDEQPTSVIYEVERTKSDLIANIIYLWEQQSLPLDEMDKSSLEELTMEELVTRNDILEDAIIIYRISCEPERRVFYVDVGELTASRAAWLINEIGTRSIW